MRLTILIAFILLLVTYNLYDLNRTSTNAIAIRNCSLSQINSNIRTLETYPINNMDLQAYDQTHGTSISSLGINCESKPNCQAELLARSKEQSEKVNEVSLFTSDYWKDKAIDVFIQIVFFVFGCFSCRARKVK